MTQNGAAGGVVGPKVPSTIPDSSTGISANGLPINSKRSISQSSASNDYSGSPALNPTLSFSEDLSLTKSSSLRSHVSVPVTGAFPFGSLQLHRPAETPGSSTESIMEDEAIPEPPSPPPTANFLENGDIFLILDLPEKFIVGHDIMALTAAETKVLGIRDIPRGAHFLWVSEPGAVTRCGYWYVAQDVPQIRVKQWDGYNEVLGDAASQFEVRDKKSNIESIYPKLIPHDYKGGSPGNADAPKPPPKDLPARGSPEPRFATDSILMWRQLTSAVSEKFLARITGKKSVTEWLLDTSDSARGEIHFPSTARFLKTVVGSEFNFLFPRDVLDLQLLNINSGTEYSTDTSSRILALLDDPSGKVDEADIVAELQFTFITGLHLGNFSCIEEWWHLVLKIILRAHKLVISRASLCGSLLQTLHAQMIYNDRYIAGNNRRLPLTNSSNSTAESEGSSILELIPQNTAALRRSLTVYKRRLNEALLDLGDRITAEQGIVGRVFDELEAWFWKRGWDLRSDYVKDDVNAAVDEDSGDDEYRPVVVDLDENGREVGLLSWDKD